jgi:hypothetical protein
MKSLASIRQSALAKREEIASVNSAREAEEKARRVAMAQRETELRNAQRPAIDNEERRWEIMAGMRPWETLVSSGGKTWVE